MYIHTYVCMYVYIRTYMAVVTSATCGLNWAMDVQASDGMATGNNSQKYSIWWCSIANIL
jgi:hypothetical protein